MRWFLARGAVPYDQLDAPSMHVRDDDLVGETEAFMRGEFADMLARRGEDVPTWAIINALAHSSPERMATAGDAALGIRGAAVSTWRRIFRDLRADLAALGAVDPLALQYLQVYVLEPLEAAAASQELAVPPSAWAALMRARAAIEAACR